MKMKYFQTLALVTALCVSCSAQGKQNKIVNVGKNDGNANINETDARLGLLATQLGLAPVPGASYGGGDAPPAEDYDSPPQPPPAAYTDLSSGGAHGGNMLGVQQCQCVPIEKCPSYQGSSGSGGGYVGEPGGILPLLPPQEGQHGGNVPVGGGGGGGGSSGGSYGGGDHGGNLPIVGEKDPGYGGAGGPPPGPNTDGEGLLDLRIVNRPPGSANVQCLNGHVFCCDTHPPQQPQQPEYPSTGGSGGNGYAVCGSRNFIDVGRKLDYGEAKFGAYPWMAVILGKGNNYVGAGALVSPFYVLTAAHKIKSWKPGAAMKVRFGEWNAKEDDEPYKNVEVEIESVLIHPRFNIKNLQNDIALVRLAQPIDVKSYPHIRSACLPQKGHSYAGQRCWVAGFGKDAFSSGRHSYIMKEVDLPIMDSNTCESRLRTTRLGPYFELNRYSFLCAGGEEGKDACTGDGGAPLVCQTGKGGNWEVVGLVAWGVGCADYGIPGVYVNVPNYVEWINEEIYRY